MSTIIDRLEDIKKLSNSSLTSIIDVTNLNFKNLAEAGLSFLNTIEYDESTNSFTVNKGTFTYVDINDTLSMKVDGVTTFKIDSLGRAEGQELRVVISESKRHRLTNFNDWPDVGVPGEIIYTGIQNNKPEFGEDIIGYLAGRGWVSLTNLTAPVNDIKLLYEVGSPIVLPTPDQGTSQLWVGPPGLQNAYEPVGTTIYLTDDDNNTFDILTNHVWRKDGDNAYFKLSGKAVIGTLTSPGGFQFIDGNQSSGYVLQSDGQGNATWVSASALLGIPNYAYWEIHSFTADVTETITHNLETTNIVIDFIDIATNERVEGHADNYTNNTVDITLTETKPTVKVIILAAGGIDAGDIVQRLNTDDKNLVALDTITIGSPGTPALATNDTISHTPINGSYVEVKVNGVEYEVGDGVTDKSFYFSGDGGLTARSFSSLGPNGRIQAGDQLFWNGNYIDLELKAGWRISLLYIF
jgi:hypothetical protein